MLTSSAAGRRRPARRSGADRTDFVREAVERELKRREAKKANTRRGVARGWNSDDDDVPEVYAPTMGRSVRIAVGRCIFGKRAIA